MRDRPGELEQEVFVNLLRTFDTLQADFVSLLRGRGISEPQFNVLRILRGAGCQGLPCQHIGDRMITRVPDVTRLLDRLEIKGLVERVRGRDDRRVVLARIKDEGLRLLADLDLPVLEKHRSQLAHLNREELREMNRLLVKAREKTVL